MIAVADEASGTIRATIDIARPPEDVFRALTDPSELAAWWGSDDSYRTGDWQVDLRPGGRWSCTARAPNGEGPESTLRGEYIVVDPPRALEFTWEPSWDGFRRSQVRYDLVPTAEGTRLTVLHSGFAGDPKACRDHADGWERVLAFLATHYESEPGASAPGLGARGS